jgi:DNA-binding transcriptional MerR regulator
MKHSIIHISKLWHWDRKGITNPVRIGNAKRYRSSDLDKLLKQ